MFEVQGYKKFEDKAEIIGAYAIQTKRYQKRVDTLKSWESVPVCKLNDKLFLNITETNVNTFPRSPSFSVELVHEGEDDVWADLKLYSITQEQIENNLSKYEEKLKKMWAVFNEENCNV